MKVLITGISGFVGSYLKELCIKNKDEVFGFDIKDGQDLLNYEQIRNFLDKVRPDEIYHLAAQAFVPESFNDPKRTFEVNVGGTINLLEAVKNLGLKPKILITGSSEEYGLVEFEECPIDESQPLRPQSPYAISKVAQDFLGKWYADNYGLDIVRTRAFNHTGAGRPECYVTSSFAKQIAQIEKYGGVLRHGNLDVIRDITDVRDMVRAYRMAINLRPGVYNIGRGEGFQIKYILDTLKKMSTKEIKTDLDKSRMRRTEVPILICNSDKFRKLTKWKPEIKIKKTLSDMLNFWRERV